MAISYHVTTAGGSVLVFCLSSDTKPTAINTTWILWETDTGNRFRWDGGAWVATSGLYSGLSGIPSTFAPSAHASSHALGGSDAVKLDDLAMPDDNTDLNASTSTHGLLRKLDGLTTTFLRGDGTWATPSGGAGATATTVEAALGALAWQGKFTITDAAISASSKVLCWQAPGPYTGKGTRADEAEMQPVQVVAVNPASGSATVYWQTPPMLSMKRVLDDGARDAAGLRSIGWATSVGPTSSCQPESVK